MDRPELIKLGTTNPVSLATIAVEKRVYERLGLGPTSRHPNIISCLRIESYGLHLERAKHGAIRE